MTSLAVPNTTAISANCTISPNIILDVRPLLYAIYRDELTLCQDAGAKCSIYMEALQTCSTTSISPALRLEAANQTAYCIQNYERSLYPDSKYKAATIYDLGDPVVIKGDSKCEFPDFLPVSRCRCRALQFVDLIAW